MAEDLSMIFLDSNVFFNDFLLKSHEARLLENYLVASDSLLVIPQVVIDEVIGLFAEQVEDLREISSRLFGIWKGLGLEGEPIEKLSFERMVTTYPSDLSQRLNELNCRVLPYPEVSHKELVEKAVKSKKPFKGGDKYKDAGYRDALIWGSIIEAIDDNTPSILITNNVNDFYSQPISDTPRLHPDLVEELESISKSAKNIILLRSLREFNEKFSKPILNVVYKKGIPIAGSPIENIDPNQILLDYEEYALGQVYDKLPLLLNVSFTDIHISDIRMFRWPESPEILEALELEDENVILTIQASFGIDANIHASQDIFSSIMTHLKKKPGFLMDLRASESSDLNIVIRLWLRGFYSAFWDNDYKSVSSIDLVDLRFGN